VSEADIEELGILAQFVITHDIKDLNPTGEAVFRRMFAGVRCIGCTAYCSAALVDVPVSLEKQLSFASCPRHTDHWHPTASRHFMCGAFGMRIQTPPI